MFTIVSRSNYAATHNALLAVLSFLYGHTVQCTVHHRVVCLFVVNSLQFSHSKYDHNRVIGEFFLALRNPEPLSQAYGLHCLEWLIGSVSSSSVHIR
jgi:hypothetical protein